MSFLSKLVTLFGLVLLTHAGYSAHEHTVLFNNTRLALPHDIIVETLVAVVIVSIGLVLGADKLKPISWRDWAGQIERDGGARNPYLGLEERYGFWDIRAQVEPVLAMALRLCSRVSGIVVEHALTISQAKRKEFGDWMRGQDLPAKQ
ncbi:unnamed protein product [Penicillium pancosmium]